MRSCFMNRFRTLDKWNDRILDADYHGDYRPSLYRSDPSMFKYDIFLRPGWSWYNVSSWQDCQRIETFRSMVAVKLGLRDAVKLCPESDVCKSCPHLAHGVCNA